MQDRDDLAPLLLPIHLLNDPLIDALALIPESRFESKSRSFVRFHDGDSSSDRFEEGNRAEICFDVVVVLVSFLL